MANKNTTNDTTEKITDSEKEPSFSVEFTEKEGTLLMQLIDIAVKSGGLQVAASALSIASKVQNAADLASKQ